MPEKQGDDTVTILNINTNVLDSDGAQILGGKTELKADNYISSYKRNFGQGTHSQGNIIHISWKTQTEKSQTFKLFLILCACWLLVEG